MTVCERVRIHNPEQERRTFRASLREAEILDFLYIKKKKKKERLCRNKLLSK